MTDSPRMIDCAPIQLLIGFMVNGDFESVYQELDNLSAKESTVMSAMIVDHCWTLYTSSSVRGRDAKYIRLASEFIEGLRKRA